MTTKSRTTRAGARTTYSRLRPAGGLAMQARGGVVM